MIDYMIILFIRLLISFQTSVGREQWEVLIEILFPGRTEQGLKCKRLI